MNMHKSIIQQQLRVGQVGGERFPVSIMTNVFVATTNIFFLFRLAWKKETGENASRLFLSSRKAYLFVSHRVNANPLISPFYNQYLGKGFVVKGLRL